MCQQCGKRPQGAQDYHKGFEYHHIVPRSQGGPDTLENLILLCHDCHNATHRKHPAQESISAIDPGELFGHFACLHCGQSLNPDTVEMNCGWYRCHACARQTHLFEHFYGP
jgi:hypothetical protein